MRRNDREITDESRIDEIIRACDCCRLGFVDGTSCYIVPLNFGFTYENGKRVFYFHGAREGRKLDLARKNGTAGFELDTDHRLNSGGDVPCKYSFRFASVIGTGDIVEVLETAEKRTALHCIMNQCAGERDWHFPEHVEKSVSILKLTVTELRCKAHA